MLPHRESTLAYHQHPTQLRPTLPICLPRWRLSSATATTTTTTITHNPFHLLRLTLPFILNPKPYTQQPLLWLRAPHRRLLTPWTPELPRTPRPRMLPFLAVPRHPACLTSRKVRGILHALRRTEQLDSHSSNRGPRPRRRRFPLRPEPPPRFNDAEQALWPRRTIFRLR